MILFHNESSHLPQWPLRQFFFCVIPSSDRGETPLLDCRRVYEALDPELREEFAEKGLMYVRNFSEGIDVPWQDFFNTTDRAEVERVCAEAGMGCEWTANDGLRISQVTPAVVDSPADGREAVLQPDPAAPRLVPRRRDARRRFGSCSRRRTAAERLLRRRHADPGRGHATRSASCTRSSASRRPGRPAT